MEWSLIPNVPKQITEKIETYAKTHSTAIIIVTAVILALITACFLIGSQQRTQPA